MSNAGRKVEFNAFLFVDMDRNDAVGRGNGAAGVVEIEQIGMNVYRVVARAGGGDAQYIFREPGSWTRRPAVGERDKVSTGAVGLEREMRICLGPTEVVGLPKACRSFRKHASPIGAYPVEGLALMP